MNKLVSQLNCLPKFNYINLQTNIILKLLSRIWWNVGFSNCLHIHKFSLKSEILGCQVELRLDEMVENIYQNNRRLLIF